MTKKKETTFKKHPPSILFQDASLYLKAKNLQQIQCLDSIKKLWDAVESDRMDIFWLEHTLDKMVKECNL